MREDWDYLPLGSVVSFLGGGTPSKRNKAFWGGDIPWVSPKDMKSREMESSIDYITQDAVQNSAVRLVPPGAVLIVVRSGILARTIPIAVAGRDLTVNQDLKALCPSEAILTEFLRYFLEASESKILGLVTRGATVHRLSTESLKQLVVPLPSLPEQKRIVAILDEAFAGIDAAIANTEKNLKNARELFESYLNAVFCQFGDECPAHPLGEVCQTGAGGTPLRSRTDYYEGGDIPWLLSGEVGKGNITAATHFITQEGLENSSAKVFPENTVLVAMYGATAGEVGILRIAASTNQAVCGILPNEQYVPEFLFYLLRFRKTELVAQATGNAQPNISQRKIRQVLVPTLPLDRQEDVVQRLHALAEYTYRLSSVYEVELSKLRVLRESILQKAFAGELSATETEGRMAVAGSSPSVIPSA